jgi:glycosyltransferase involved in cell wall biosynthesis
MRVLVVTKIFPNRAQPAGATYNQHQLGELSRTDHVEVMAVIPWLPGARLFGKAAPKGIPARDVIDGLDVRHPRALYAPGPSRSLSGAIYAASLLPHVARRRGDFDVVLGCFAYPDGWAAVTLSRVLGVPAVIKVHGSDVNVLGRDPLVVPLLRQAFRRAAAVVGPSQALVDRAVELGAHPRRSRMVPNGTDRNQFFPRDRDSCRRELGHGNDNRPWIVFIGRLSAAKGAVDLLEAFATVHRTEPDVRLVLVGDGVDEQMLRHDAERRGLPVIFAGSRPPEEIPLWIGASQLLALPSHNEGTPNVVLEALASGRRVVTSDVGGIPAVMHDPAFGEMVPARAPVRLASALLDVLSESYDPDALSEAAPVIDWTESAAILRAVLLEATR